MKCNNFKYSCAYITVCIILIIFPGCSSFDKQEVSNENIGTFSITNSPEPSAVPETSIHTAEVSPFPAASTPLETAVIAVVTPSEIIVEPAKAEEPHEENIPELPSSEQPPLLSRIVENEGLAFDNLNFKQLILVAANGTQADVYCYGKTDGIWSLACSFDGYIGANGISYGKLEGDKCTPAGLYSLGFAFGTSENPGTLMEYRNVTDDVYWVDDPVSAYYNMWVYGTENQDWNSAEHLSEYINSYAYALVIEYNYYPDTVPGKGSAIFLHCGTSTIYGCVTVAENDMVEILKWLSPENEPHILIAPD